MRRNGEYSGLLEWALFCSKFDRDVLIHGIDGTVSIRSLLPDSTNHDNPPRAHDVCIVCGDGQGGWLPASVQRCGGNHFLAMLHSTSLGEPSTEHEDAVSYWISRGFLVDTSIVADGNCALDCMCVFLERPWNLITQ